MSALASILIVEDDRSLALQLKWFLKENHQVDQAFTAEEARKALAGKDYDVMLLDLGLPPHPENPLVGLSLLHDVADAYPYLKVIVLTAHGDQQTARDALSFGAYDFLVKPVNETLLYTLIKRAFYRRELETEFLEGQKTDLPIPMVVISDKMKRVIQAARAVATLPVSCIILGETGTGKELIAQILHLSGTRKNKAMIVVECSSIPVTLGEAELFGAEKGSYTGSTAKREGRIKQAEEGTLFLDEVGELSLELQSKLLRFLEAHEYTPIGGKTCKADVKIIAATNRNLPQEVKRGKFRLDLYHRLCQVEITIPPLRERPEEIIPLASYFLTKLGHEFRISPPPITTPAEKALVNHSFPGNVRELRNILSRALILSKGRPIGTDELGLEEEEGREPRMPMNANPGFDLPLARTNLERRWIEEALRRRHNKITAAAADLAIPRPTLYDLMRKHGIGDQGEGEGT